MKKLVIIAVIAMALLTGCKGEEQVEVYGPNDFVGPMPESSRELITVIYEDIQEESILEENIIEESIWISDEFRQETNYNSQKNPF